MVPGLSFVRITKENFSGFKDILVASEGCYDPALQSSEQDIYDVVEEPDSIVLAAFLDGKYVGNVLSCSYCEDEKLEDRISQHLLDKKLLYIFNIVIEPDFRKKGLAKEILREALKIAKEEGFEAVAGHFRKAGSVQVIKSFGGVEKHVCPNWEGSTEEFVYCELELDGFDSNYVRDSGRSSADSAK